MTALKPYITRFTLACEDIDRQAAQSGPRSGQALVTLLTAAACLLLIHYLKYFSAYQDFSAWLCDWNQTGCHLLNAGTLGRFAPLEPHIWWAFWHVLGYVLIPLFVIRYVFRQSPMNFGLRLGDLARHMKWYFLLAAPILCFAVLASFGDEFTRVYPFYKLAHRSWLDLLAWEALYLLQFVCLEFFFRGFMLEGCRSRLGVMAIPVMALPYLMIHFSKPWPEALGALPFGLILGFLAMRSRSIWGGVMVHAGIALTMDLAALLQTRGMPAAFQP